MRHSSINYLMGDIGRSTQRFKPRGETKRYWIGEAISAGGALIGGLLSGDKDGGSGTVGKIQPSTVGRATIGDKDVLYREQAIGNMDAFIKQMADFTASDRTFFESVYQPFQQTLAQTNQALLPTIERVAGATLEANARDLFGNEALKNSLRASGADTSSLENLRAQVANIPTTEERVGQALTNVEGQFSQAGQELARDFQSRGQTVSQASRRALAFEKAKTKAGAAGAAAEAARREQLEGATTLIGAEGATAARRGQDVQSLSQLQQAQQAGLATPQVGGLRETTGLEAAGLESGVTTAAGLQTFGTRERSDVVTQTQKGVKSPALTSGAGGGAIAPAGLAQPGTPGTDTTQAPLAGLEPAVAQDARATGFNIRSFVNENPR